MYLRWDTFLKFPSRHKNFCLRHRIVWVSVSPSISSRYRLQVPAFESIFFFSLTLSSFVGTVAAAPFDKSLGGGFRSYNFRRRVCPTFKVFSDFFFFLENFRNHFDCGSVTIKGMRKQVYSRLSLSKRFRSVFLYHLSILTITLVNNLVCHTHNFLLPQTLCGKKNIFFLHEKYLFIFILQ